MWGNFDIFIITFERGKSQLSNNMLKSDLNQGIDRPGSHTNALEHNESSLLIQKLIYLPGTQ